MIPGSGTTKTRKELLRLDNVQIFNAPNIDEAVKLSIEKARKGDKILFSPAFKAVGIDVSRKERGEKFVKSVRAL